MRIRLGDDRSHRWEFEKDGEAVELDVPGAVLLDETHVGLALVRSGAGLMFTAEPMLPPLAAEGAMRFVLKN